MTTGSPLIFRPSVAQRALAGLLCLGCWLVGIRAVTLLIAHLPTWIQHLSAAQAAGEGTLVWWCLILGGVAACALAGLAMLAVVVGFILIEGCQVLTDALGVTVEYHTLPTPLARWFGAGRLAWKQILVLEKRGWTFIVAGDPRAKEVHADHPPKPVLRLRFLLVAELERLILLILERSPNLK